MVVHALVLQAQRSLLLYKQHLADLVWTGYEQVRAVYDLAAATAHTPAEAERIRALEPAFRRLDEATLFAWVDAEADVGKKMNVAGVDPAVLLSLARYHLSLREREREQGRWEADRLIRLGEYKIKLWQLMLGVGGFGVLVGGTVRGLIGG